MARPFSLQLTSYSGTQPLNSKDHPSLSLLAVAAISWRGRAQEGHEHHTQAITFSLPPARVMRVEVDEEALELDESLRGVPFDFIRDKLRQLGPAMLASTEEQVTGAELHAGCTFAPPSKASSAPIPSQSLLITFEDSSQPLLLPVHGLVWALTSPLLASLANPSSEAPPFPLDLPSSSSFHLFHTWMYLRSTTALLTALSTFTDNEPTPAHASPEDPELVALCSAQEPEALLAKLEMLSGLYRNAVALQVWDDELWTTMKGAWRTLVDGLQVSLKRRRREQTEEPVE
ncbi:hypothetical protein BCR35DRAFT_159458 [Leucosporidium creatinivorum]|uniref:Uncharacterized protein n=1 Tax=Leucosporidium creatinivorum TaxID=106004 RepID=A0A1Y2G094_9BASI|nr:hypothetical protein BCR35DRAFT_159458 [Leucosporidium creatinivorum]